MPPTCHAAGTVPKVETPEPIIRTSSLPMSSTQNAPAPFPAIHVGLMNVAVCGPLGPAAAPTPVKYGGGADPSGWSEIGGGLLPAARTTQRASENMGLLEVSGFTPWETQCRRDFHSPPSAG